MTFRNLSPAVAKEALVALVSAGHLTHEALVDMFVALVNGVFEELDATPMRKIYCIKAVRDLCGLGLREAKDLVDEHDRMFIDSETLIDLIHDQRNDEDMVLPEQVQQMVKDSAHNSRVDVDALKVACLARLREQYATLG